MFAGDCGRYECPNRLEIINSHSIKRAIRITRTHKKRIKEQTESRNMSDKNLKELKASVGLINA